jgi:type I restriction-modification system DNA methylase subunit
MADERSIVADLKSYVDELRGESFNATVEKHASGITRADLVVRYKGNILFNAEFKKPTVIEGRNPRSGELVEDAFLKSQKLETPSQFFITSNFNETILWDNRDATVPLMSRGVRTFSLPTTIKKEEDLESNTFNNEIREIIHNVTRTILDLFQNNVKIHYKALGDSFIEGLNAHLGVAADIASSRVPVGIMRKWWKEQQYAPTDFGEPERKLISRYSLYVLSNKIMFYYVLSKTFNDLPKEIKIQESAKRIGEIEKMVKSAFNAARETSMDYETVFSDDPTGADKIPFVDDEMVFPIRSLIKFLNSYNFSSVTQDVFGNIYDRLISPNERHDNGQYFTPIPVVDLINAITIKNAEARVLDPACGSGTFLTRAFDLKLSMTEDSAATREKIFSELFGVDIASYPAHLATVALSSKLLLQNPDAYPNIIRSDFLDVQTEAVVPRWRFTPARTGELKTTDLNGAKRTVEFKPIDAVVGNLPYIRQEDIDNKKKEQEKVETFLEGNGFKKETPNNTSDFHVYFWYHILPFLKEGSRVGFLTSDTWLNVEYGNDLKKFITNYFKIIAIIDSSVERWFEGALVNTVITILERTDSKEKRDDNNIKFVRINGKVSEIVRDIEDAVKIAKKIENGQSSDFVKIVREVRQGDMGFEDVLKAKLFPYLRAPEEFFELVKNKNMVPLSRVVEVQRGFTTGVNEFFYVEDVTENFTPQELNERFGLRKGETRNIRAIRDGTGELHLMERKYLKPVLKSPREFTTTGTLKLNGTGKKHVVLISESNRKKISKHALKYIEHGESFPIKEPYCERPTCRGRDPWWRLSPVEIPDLVFADQLSSTFLSPKTDMLLDKKLYLGKMKKGKESDLIAVYSFMNSTLSYLYPDFYGRSLGGGSTTMAVYEYQQIPVVNPEVLRPYYRRLEKRMKKLESRKIGPVTEEIWNRKGKFDLKEVREDRLELDKLILKSLGIQNIDDFLLKWYPAVVQTVRERLDKAKSLKTTKNGRRESLEKVADEILKEMEVKDFPRDYLTEDETNGEIELSSSTDILGISKGRDLNGWFVSVGEEKRYFEGPEMMEYAFYCARHGIFKIPVPRNPEEVVEEIKEDLKGWSKTIEKGIEEITDNEEYREKLKRIISAKAGYPGLL